MTKAQSGRRSFSAASHESLSWGLFVGLPGCFKCIFGMASFVKLGSRHEGPHLGPFGWFAWTLVAGLSFFSGKLPLKIRTWIPL